MRTVKVRSKEFMKILVIGFGGREHAICRAFKQSDRNTEIFCANGNAGIAEIATLVDIQPDSVLELADYVEQQSIDLTFVGGEKTLALGIVDEFEKRNLKIIGAHQRAARLESSKAFAKDFMRRHRIPTANYETAESASVAAEILGSGAFGDENSPVVIKADGLAAGKGVVVAKNRAEALQAIEELTSGSLISTAAAEKIVLEECLFGQEVSLLLFADGKNFSLMPPLRDHKRIFENDLGANTGGMGTICDDNLLTLQHMDEIIEKIIKPTLEGAAKEGFEFRGILFLGLMLTDNGVKVLEYNVRFGDPETQSVLLRLETDFTEICEGILEQSLDNLNIKWKKGSSACVILAAENYPNQPKTGEIISGLDEANRLKNVFVFHSGTKRNERGEILSAGGRVLGVTATGENLDEALKTAYDAVRKVSFNGMQYRRDIGKTSGESIARSIS